MQKVGIWKNLSKYIVIVSDVMVKKTRTKDEKLVEEWKNVGRFLGMDKDEFIKQVKLSNGIRKSRKCWFCNISEYEQPKYLKGYKTIKLKFGEKVMEVHICPICLNVIKKIK